jgi:hypothetical protein
MAMHPEIARFQAEFNTRWVPEGVEFEVGTQNLRGERRNTDWSRLGLATGAFIALALCGAGMIYIPVFNLAWAGAMLTLLLVAPYFGARAALFRYRKGRKKSFELDFSSMPPRWHSNDDEFWEPVRSFFKL